VLDATTKPGASAAEDELARVREALKAAQATIAQLTQERDKLREAYLRLMEQHELLRRRIYAAKAERVDSSQLAEGSPGLFLAREFTRNGACLAVHEEVGIGYEGAAFSS